MGLKSSKINKHIYSKEDINRPIVYYFNNIEDPMINERVRRKYRRIQASIDSLKVFGRLPYKDLKRWNSTGDLAFNRGNNSERFKKASKSLNNLVEDEGPSPEDQLNDLVQKLKEIRRRIKNYDGKESTAEIKMDLDLCLSQLNIIDSNNQVVLELRAKMGEKINYYQESIEQKCRKYSANQTKVEEIEAKIEELTGDIEYYYRTGEQEEYQTIKTSIDACVKLLDCLDARDDASMMKLKENYEKTLFDYDHEIDNINSKAAAKTLAYNLANSVDTDDEFYDCFEEIPLTPKSVKSEVERTDDFEYYSRKLDQVEQNFEKLMSEKSTCLREKEPPESPRRNKLHETKNKSAFEPKMSIESNADNVYEIIGYPEVVDENLCIYGEKTSKETLPLKPQTSMKNEEDPPKLRPRFKEEQPKKIHEKALVHQVKSEENAQLNTQKSVGENIYDTIDEAKALLYEKNINENSEYATVVKKSKENESSTSQITLNDGDEPPKLRPKFKEQQTKKTDGEVNDGEIYQINENVGTSKLGKAEENIYETIDVAKALVDEMNLKKECENLSICGDKIIQKDLPLKPQTSIKDEEEPPKLRPRFKEEQPKKICEEALTHQVKSEENVRENPQKSVDENAVKSKLKNDDENIYDTIDEAKALLEEKNIKENCEYATVIKINKENESSKPQINLNDGDEPPKLRPKFKEQQTKKSVGEVNDKENVGTSKLEKDEENIYETIDVAKALVDEMNFKKECENVTVPDVDGSQIYYKVMKNEPLKPEISVNEEEPPKLRPRFKDEQPKKIALDNDDEIYQINVNAVKSNAGIDEDNMYDIINEEKALIDEKNFKQECIYEPMPVIKSDQKFKVNPVNSNIEEEKLKLQPRFEADQPNNNDPDENYQYEEFAHPNDENKDKHIGNNQQIEEQRSQGVAPKPQPRAINNPVYGNIVVDNTQNNKNENYVSKKQDYIQSEVRQENFAEAKAIEEKTVKEYAIENKQDNNESKFKEIEESITKTSMGNLESSSDCSQKEIALEECDKFSLDEQIVGRIDNYEKDEITKNFIYGDVELRKKNTSVNENYKNAEVVLTPKGGANIYDNPDVNSIEKKRMKLADISESTAFSQTFSDEESEDFSEDEPLASSAAISDDENRRLSHIPKLLSVIYEESSFDEESVRTKEDSSEECTPSSESPPMSRRFSVNPMPDSTRIAFDSVLECVQNMKECVDYFEGTKTDSDYISIYENLMKSMSILNSFKVDDNETIEYKQRILHEIIQCMNELEGKVKPSFTY